MKTSRSIIVAIMAVCLMGCKDEFLDAYEDAQGVIVTGDMAADGSISNRKYAPDPSVQERAWNPDNSFYFLPIKLDEINRNKLLVQNPQY